MRKPKFVVVKTQAWPGPELVEGSAGPQPHLCDLEPSRRRGGGVGRAW